MASQTHSKGGRPTKYDEKYVGELLEYFESFVEDPFTKEVVREETLFHKEGGKKAHRVEYKFVSKRLPTLFGFARKIKIDYSTVYRWAEARVGAPPKDDEPDKRPYQYPEFRNAYKSRILYQTEFLTAVGLGGIAPPASYVFTAKNVIGWRDAIEQRLVDKDGKDAATPGYVLLPARRTPEEAAADYEAAQRAAVEPPPDVPEIQLGADLPDKRPES